MPSCVVLGCKSRTSNKSSKASKKCSLFSIPRGMLDTWRAAIRRENDDKVQYGQFVCEKHFNSTEILWKTELYAADGTVLGVSHHKIPRLKAGAIPSIFDWTESANNDNSKSAESMETPPTSPRGETVDGAGAGEINGCHEDDITTGINSDLMWSSGQLNGICDEEINDLLEDSESEFNDEMLTFEVLINAKLICPFGWIQQLKICGNIRIIDFFVTDVVEVVNGIKTIIQKEVIVKEDMTVQVNLWNEPRKASELPLNVSSIKTMEQIQELINTVHHLELCRGSVLQNALNQISSNIVYNDVSETWRHVQCPLWLDNYAKHGMCKFCQRIKKTVAMRIRRAKRGENIKNIRIILTANDNGKVERLVDELHSPQQNVDLNKSEIF